MWSEPTKSFPNRRDSCSNSRYIDVASARDKKCDFNYIFNFPAKDKTIYLLNQIRTPFNQNNFYAEKEKKICERKQSPLCSSVTLQNEFNLIYITLNNPHKLRKINFLMD